MNELNILTATFKPGARVCTPDKKGVQYDYGQVLKIAGLDLPEAFEVHFANTGDTTTITQIAQNGVVEIPDQFFRSSKQINAFIFLHDGETDGETEYKITIGVLPRPAISDEEPTPEEQSAITQAIAALQSAVAHTAQSETNAAASAESAATSASTAAMSAQNAADSETTAGEAAQAAQQSAEDAAGSASAAAQSASEAQTSEDNAEDSAEEARRYKELAEQIAGTAGYMFMEIDDRGRLIYTRTDQVDADFSISRPAGHLILEAV